MNVNVSMSVLAQRTQSWCTGTRLLKYYAMLIGALGQTPVYVAKLFAKQCVFSAENMLYLQVDHLLL